MNTRRIVMITLGGLAALTIACSAGTDDVSPRIADIPGEPGKPAVAVTKEPVGPATTITEGTFEVGKDIVAGTYSATVPADSFICYWERQSDLSGSFAGIITNETGSAGAKMKVTIAATDKGFKTNGCGTWTLG